MLSRLQRELGRDVRLLVELRLLETVIRVGEVRAAVLQIVVEEEAIKIVADVVMVGDIPASPLRDILRAEKRLEWTLALAERLAAGAAVLPAVRSGNELHQVEDVAVLDD